MWGIRLPTRGMCRCAASPNRELRELDPGAAIRFWPRGEGSPPDGQLERSRRRRQERALCSRCQR